MRLKLIPTTLAVLAGATCAQADLFENFDGYANQAAFNAAWTVSSGSSTTLALQSTTSYSSPNAVMVSATTAYQFRRQMGGVAADSMDFSFRFYEVGGSRDILQLYSRAGGGAWTDGLNTTLAFGTWNTGSGSTRYMGRISSYAGVVFGDGAVSDGGTSGWFSLTGNSVARTPNVWHLMEVQGGLDPVNAGKVMYKFYVDGTLVGSLANATDYTFNWATMGGSASTTVAGALFDDYSVITVPEPSALTLCLLAAGAVGLRSVRRRQA